MQAVLLFFLSVYIGYLIFLYFNDPIKNPLKKKKRLPQLGYKNIEILPYFRVHIKTKTYHIHHWLTLTVITAITLISLDSMQHLLVLKGVAVGGIVQGLRYPNRFKFRQPRIR